MQNESKGKIFLASERGHTENEWFRSLQTFCFGNYKHQHKTPFGQLYVMNDDTLAGGKALQYLIEEDSVVVLLPLVGGVSFNDGANVSHIQAGESVVSYLAKGIVIEIQNPFSDALVNYMQLWFKCPLVPINSTDVFSFDIDKNRNSLVDAFSFSDQKGQAVKAGIGKFSGREEALYKLSSTLNSVFVLVIQGAFEVQNRLLESRDSLALWNVEEIDMEALSEDAIIMIIELPILPDKRTIS